MDIPDRVKRAHGKEKGLTDRTKNIREKIDIGVLLTTSLWLYTNDSLRTRDTTINRVFIWARWESCE